ncbi:MAG: hypothetical protein EXR04_07910, partial [Rhodospirillales bacterium]|nr:hypothetical protein [Rhodospirillales bacterium]
MSSDSGAVTTAKPAAAFWRRHPVDIRFSLPFLGNWFYVTVVSGPERRTDERQAEQRHHYPLRTAANVFFVLGLGAGFYALALVVFAFASSIVE